ncbi:MAG: hypothetical protein VX156_08230, partial [Pseudomonadota bacterium]|nr:hypothetical protein [Pseudomonadota bacterium]
TTSRIEPNKPTTNGALLEEPNAEVTIEVCKVVRDGVVELAICRDPNETIVTSGFLTAGNGYSLHLKELLF